MTPADLIDVEGAAAPLVLFATSEEAGARESVLRVARTAGGVVVRVR